MTYQKVEAEAGTLSGAATVVTPAASWTVEAQWSGGAYVDMLATGSDTLVVNAPVDGDYAVYVVFDKQPVKAQGVGVQVSVDGMPAGADDGGGAGAQGDSPNPDNLWIDSVRVPQALTAGPHAVALAYMGDGSTHARIDAVLLQPLIEDKVLTDGARRTLAFYKSLSPSASSGALPTLAGAREWAIRSYDHNGDLVAD